VVRTDQGGADRRRLGPRQCPGGGPGAGDLLLRSRGRCGRVTEQGRKPALRPGWPGISVRDGGGGVVASQLIRVELIGAGWGFYVGVV